MQNLTKNPNFHILKSDMEYTLDILKINPLNLTKLLVFAASTSNALKTSFYQLNTYPRNIFLDINWWP